MSGPPIVEAVRLKPIPKTDEEKIAAYEAAQGDAEQPRFGSPSNYVREALPKKHD